MAERYSLDELRQRAATQDISYDLQRLYGDKLEANDPEVHEVLRTGHVAAAARWLKSTTPEGMKYGIFTRDQRINKAVEHAAAAEYPLELIAEEHDLSDLL